MSRGAILSGLLALGPFSAAAADATLLSGSLNLQIAKGDAEVDCRLALGIGYISESAGEAACVQPQTGGSTASLNCYKQALTKRGFIADPRAAADSGPGDV